MFINPSVENGHWHPTNEYMIGGWHYPIVEGSGPPVMELQLPNSWRFRWADHTIENPYSPDTWNQFVRPEFRVLSADELPEHERALYIVHGTHTMKIFKGYGSWYAALYQEFEFEDGIYQVHTNIYNDAVEKYVNGKKVPPLNPHACQARIVINGEPSEWRPLFPQYMDAEAFLFTAYEADEKTRVEVEIMMPYALHNSGVFADLWNIVEIQKVTEECTHIGLPREQYERTYVLLPSGYNASWARAVISGSWNARRYTVGASADDAGLGDLTDKTVIIVNPLEWENSILEFYAIYYPHTKILTITATNQVTLTQKLADQDFDDPEPPPPPPNGEYKGPVYPKVTRGHWGLHVQILRDGVWPYLQNTVPGVMKYFGLSDVEISVNVEPRTPVIYRHYTVDQNIPDDEAAMHQVARDYIATFSDDTHRKAESLSVKHDHRPLFYIESYNEMYPSLNRPVVHKAALFDAVFAEEMNKEFGEYVGAALYCAAVGNPHESEYNELLRVAEAAVKYNGVLGYHAYWWANEHENGLLPWWEYHAGRWQDIDKYFRKHHLYPCWYSGEAGVVYSGDGYALNPGAGWLYPAVYNGDLDRLMADLAVTDGLATEWNAKYGNRWWGSTFFTTGASYTGWGWFQFQKREMEALSAYLIEKYPTTPQAYALLGRDEKRYDVSSVRAMRKRLSYKARRTGRMLRYKVI